MTNWRINVTELEHVILNAELDFYSLEPELGHVLTHILPYHVLTGIHGKLIPT